MSGTDRISDLPDALLTHILSYLPTKEAVQTCLLSKQWRKVWASVPVLDFDFADFLSDDIFSPGKNVTVQTECYNNFVQFVDAVLRQAQHLDRFRLVWQCQDNYYRYCDFPVKRWILLVLQKRPRVLSIYIQSPPVSAHVPDLAFTCSSLEEMKLRFDNLWFHVLNPVLVCLPLLRKLNLELRVSAPSLQYLEIAAMSCLTAGFVFENMSSLVKACVCFLTVDHLKSRFSDSETNILNGLLGVTNLDVVLYGSRAEDMLKHALKNCPFFENLKAAHFESFKGYLFGGIGMIDRFVQHAPILEDLTFHCYKDTSDEIELLMELRKVVGDHRNCRSVESMQGHNYGSLDELEGLSLEYWKIFYNNPWEFEEGEEDDEEEEEQLEEDVGGGEAWMEEEAGEDVEAGLEEEDKQDVV
ncbi:hypothetical protein LUZ61_019921 [Rhynchospora tenuis]|uniref:F-box domain-containing protein n=1 Tax=Rhynchospora tenuis TaxID=198213 RepID=A0AAD5ZC17_9POAL|nr:hypothetical protein LUZ61_019921 [Rhynchospora tenuis]